MSQRQQLDTQRIDYLLDRETVQRKVVTIIGLGSGGAPIVQLLSMCGLETWHLFDPDTLDELNLVKHPALRSQIGQLKTDILAEWVRDRNPRASVHTYATEVQQSAQFVSAAEQSDLIICAADNNPTRSFVNETCVSLRKACITGLVFRTGFGGQVYTYIPGETGCYSCMERFTSQHGGNLDDILDLTDEEHEHLYGLNDKTFSASGLAIDISLIASIHAHMSLALLVGRIGTSIPPLSFNAATFGTRPQRGAFTSRFEARRWLLRPQADCHLACGEAHLAAEPGAVIGTSGAAP